MPGLWRARSLLHVPRLLSPSEPTTCAAHVPVLIIGGLFTLSYLWWTPRCSMSMGGNLWMNQAGKGKGGKGQ